jgi:hypothetical protein
MKRLIHGCFTLLAAALLAFTATACQNTSTAATNKPAAAPTAAAPTPAAPAAAARPAAPAAAAAPTAPAATARPTPAPAAAAATPAAAGRPTIRVACGSEEAVTDANGVKWSADTGSEDGSTISRPELTVTGTKTPQIFQAERYGMSAYSFKVPNGKYKLNLYFSEGYEGNTEPDSRLFDYAIKDGDAAKGKVIKEVKNFSPWKASGAAAKAYVDSNDITVTQDRITITFNPIAENPQINAIEIIPQ